MHRKYSEYIYTNAVTIYAQVFTNQLVMVDNCFLHPYLAGPNRFHDLVMPATIQEKFADLFADPNAGRWLTIQCQLHRAPATIDAYGRAIRHFIAFCRTQELPYLEVRVDHIAAYIQHMYAAIWYSVRLRGKGYQMLLCSSG